jgi:hypothetical protein
MLLQWVQILFNKMYEFLLKLSSFFGLCLSSNFQLSTTFRKPALLPSSGKGNHVILVEHFTKSYYHSLDPVKVANLCNGPTRLCAFLYLKTEAGPAFET